MYINEGFTFFDGTEKGEDLCSLVRNSVIAYGIMDTLGFPIGSSDIADTTMSIGVTSTCNMLNSVSKNTRDTMIDIFARTANSWSYSNMLKKYIPHWLRLLDIHGYDAYVSAGPSCFTMKDVSTAEKYSEYLGRGVIKAMHMKKSGIADILETAEEFFDTNQVYMIIKNESRRGVKFYADAKLDRDPNVNSKIIMDKYVTLRIGLYTYPSPIYTINTMVNELTG